MRILLIYENNIKNMKIIFKRKKGSPRSPNSFNNGCFHDAVKLLMMIMIFIINNKILITLNFISCYNNVIIIVMHY